MKARDYFAGIAMKNWLNQKLRDMIPKPGEEILKYGQILAKRSYEMADMMIEASKENQKEQESKNKKVNKARQRWFCYICGGGDEYDGFVYCKKCSHTMPIKRPGSIGSALYRSENYNKTPKP